MRKIYKSAEADQEESPRGLSRTRENDSVGRKSERGIDEPETDGFSE